MNSDNYNYLDSLPTKYIIDEIVKYFDILSNENLKYDEELINYLFSINVIPKVIEYTNIKHTKYTHHYYYYNDMKEIPISDLEIKYLDILLSINRIPSRACHILGTIQNRIYSHYDLFIYSGSTYPVCPDDNLITFWTEGAKEETISKLKQEYSDIDSSILNHIISIITDLKVSFYVVSK